MKNVIKCKNCGTEIEISEALTHQIEEQVSTTLQAKHKLDIEQAKAKAIEEITKKNSEELLEEKARNKKLSEDLSALLVEQRALKRKDEDREMEMKKKLLEEEDRIRKEAREKVLEERDLKDREKDKIIEDLKKSLEEVQKKATQGSQQTQGEALELKLEKDLIENFPLDSITEVKKGQRGADLLQMVTDKLGRKSGSILWECKNAQWSDGWIAKLKEDQRQSRADISVLVSVNLPEDVKDFIYRDGVWIVSASNYVGLAFALRFNLVSLYSERYSSEGKDEKMKILYQYLTGPEFKHRVEGIIEAFGNLQEELEKEKRWFGIKWARQEKEIRKIIDHTHGMYGDFQGVVGKSLPEINILELPDGEKEEA